MNEIKIEKMVLKIGKKEVDLSLEEARELFKTLENLFGKEIVHVHHDHWYWKYYQPYVTWNMSAGATLDNQIYCGVSGNTLSLNIPQTC